MNILFTQIKILKNRARMKGRKIRFIHAIKIILKLKVGVYVEFEWDIFINYNVLGLPVRIIVYSQN